MDDQQLAKYIDKMGDRIALRNFLSTKSSTLGSPCIQHKKQGLMERLRQRIKARSLSEENETCNTLSSKKFKTSNAEKNTVKVDLGWMHFNVNNKYCQVCTKNGGGTRQVQIQKDAGKKEILSIAQDLFFQRESLPKVS